MRLFCAEDSVYNGGGLCYCLTQWTMSSCSLSLPVDLCDGMGEGIIPENTHWLLVLCSFTVTMTGWLTTVPERVTPQHR
jgi:hypothetical protein